MSDSTQTAEKAQVAGCHKCPLIECGRDIACRPPAPTCPHPFYDRRPSDG